ncbi:MAG: group II truncated hemoglobin [Nevskiales bacterium]|nr:group II truncated hemoglobin [Nevskiales bacterium]
MNDSEGVPTPFSRIGGEAVVRRLVDAFYDRMDREPAYAKLRAMHPASLDGSRDKLFWFLCGWLGGPQHFVERFGHPRLRARHLPFSIGFEERDQWLDCMFRAIADCGVEEGLAKEMARSLYSTADWMRNREEEHPDANVSA